VYIAIEEKRRNKMIFAKPLPLNEVEKNLSKEDKIAIIACNGCVRTYGVGGFEGAKKLAESLRKDGYNVVKIIVITYNCTEAYVMRIRREIPSDVNVLLSLSCTAGYSSISRMFPNKKVVKTTENVGLISIEDDRKMFEVTFPFEKFKDYKGKWFAFDTLEMVSKNNGGDQ